MGAAFACLTDFHFDEVEEASGDSVTGVTELHVVEFFVEAVFVGDQVVVGTYLDSFTVGEDKNTISVLDGRETVSDCEDCAVSDEAVNSFLDEAFAFGVESGGSFVEDEDARIFKDCAGDGDSLALAAGETDTVFANDGIVAFGKLADEGVSIGGLCGGDDLLEGDISAAVGNVVAHRVVEEDGFLCDHADLLAEGAERDVADVDAINEDGAGGDVVETGDEVDQCGFSAAAGADDSDEFTGTDGQIQIFDDGWGVRLVREVHMLKANFVLKRWEVNRTRGLGDSYWRIQESVDAPNSSRGSLNDVVQLCDAAEGFEHEEECAAEHRNVIDFLTAFEDRHEQGVCDNDEDSDTNQLRERTDDSLTADRGNAQGAEAVDKLFETVNFILLHVEGADDADADDGFGEEGDDVGDFFLSFFGEAANTLADMNDGAHEEGEADGGEEGHFPIPEEGDSHVNGETDSFGEAVNELS